MEDKSIIMSVLKQMTEKYTEVDLVFPYKDKWYSLKELGTEVINETDVGQSFVKNIVEHVIVSFTEIRE